MAAKSKAAMLKMGCPTAEPQKLGDAYTYDSACKFGGSMLKTHSVLSYSGDAAIHSVTKVDRGDGRPEITNTSDTKWVGPCKPGQKPGEGEVMNLDELTKGH